MPDRPGTPALGTTCDFHEPSSAWWASAWLVDASACPALGPLSELLSACSCRRLSPTEARQERVVAAVHGVVAPRVCMWRPCEMRNRG